LNLVFLPNDIKAQPSHLAFILRDLRVSSDCGYPSVTFRNAQSAFRNLPFFWKFPEESGNPEMAFDNYRIRPHFTQNYFAWAMVGASEGEIFGGI
jgi:hypothetical protein